MAEFPSFIWHDQTEAAQQMAHSQAINEGRRIAELGKARQAEGMFRMADLELRRKQQTESNQLQSMIAKSQLAQADIANSFRDRQLLQQGELQREHNKNYLERSKLEFSPDRFSPQQAVLERKLQVEEEDRKRAEAGELNLVTEAEKAISSLNQLEASINQIRTSGAKDINTPVINAKLGQLTQQKKAIIEGMFKKGYDYDYLNKKFIGVARSPAPAAAPAAQAVPQSALFGSPGGMIDLSDWQKATMGIQPGQSIVQDGVTYQVR